MKEIPLTRGQVALVDDEDYERLSKFKWQARWCESTKSFYAWRSERCHRVTARDGHEYFRQDQIHMHKEVLGAADQEVDHRNRNTLDNRRSNLRECSRSQNCANRPGIALSGFKGVQRNGKRGFMARVQVNRVAHYLGTFSTRELAAAAYNEAARRIFGEFAYLNQIESEG